LTRIEYADNKRDNCDDWIDCVRSEIYEERKRLGDEEYNRQMTTRVEALEKKYGFKRVKDIGGEYHNV
jgi:hypothetical protein